MQNTISPDSVVQFIDDNLLVVVGTVLRIESKQAIVKHPDGRVFTGHVDLLMPLPDKPVVPVNA